MARRSPSACGTACLVSPDGGEQRLLVTGEVTHFLSDADSSPDGRRILFVRQDACGGSCEVPSLVTVASDGTDLRTIEGSRGLEQASWSPDGQTLVAVSSGTLRILRKDGTFVRSIRPSATDVSGPSWQSFPGVFR